MNLLCTILVAFARLIEPAPAPLNVLKIKDRLHGFVLTF